MDGSITSLLQSAIERAPSDECGHVNWEAVAYRLANDFAKVIDERNNMLRRLRKIHWELTAKEGTFDKKIVRLIQE